MYLFVIFLSVSLPLYLIYWMYKYQTHLKNVPSPPCNFFTGHFAHFMDSKEILKKFTDFTIKYGSIIKIYLPPVLPTVVVTCPKAIRLITTSEKTLGKGRDYEMLSLWLGEGVLTIDVPNWKVNRRILNPCFAKQSLIKNFIKIFESKADDFIKKLDNYMDNKSLDLFPILKTFTMDVMCETSMGIEKIDDDYKRTYFKSVEKLSQITARRVVSSLKRFNFFFNFTEDARIYYESLKVVEDLFEKVMNEKLSKKDRVDQEAALTFLDMLLKFENNHDKKYIREEVNTFLFGGHDTTATGIAFTLYCLSKHPEIQEQVVAEQHEIFGEFDKVHTASITELQQMKYLELVINEAMRLYPPIPLIARKVSSDLTLDGGIVLPKGHNVCIFIYGCHHNPKYFPEPEKFIPERFQGDIIPGSFIPFSSGPRNCIGKKFALLQIKSCVSKVIRQFKLLPPKPDYQIELIPHMVLTAKNGIRLSLEKRNTE